MELSNKHKKLLDCQFKIAKPHAIISTWKKVFSSVYDYSVFNWRIRPNTRSSKPKQMSKESSASWVRGVWFTKVGCWIVWHLARDSNPCCRRERWDFSGIGWYFRHFWGNVWDAMGAYVTPRPLTNYNKFKWWLPHWLAYHQRPNVLTFFYLRLNCFVPWSCAQL